MVSIFFRLDSPKVYGSVEEPWGPPMVPWEGRVGRASGALTSRQQSSYAVPVLYFGVTC